MDKGVFAQTEKLKKQENRRIKWEITRKTDLNFHEESGAVCRPTPKPIECLQETMATVNITNIKQPILIRLLFIILFV